MSIEARIFGSMIYPAYHMLTSSAVLARIREYSRNERLEPAELRAMQEKKLDDLARHAACHVPYYAELLGAAARWGFSIADLRRLPVLTKTRIRDAGDRLIARNVPRQELEANSTSGSTGEPLYFYTDRRSSDCRKAVVVRNRRWLGIEPGDREVRLWGSQIDSHQASALRGRLHAWLTRSKFLSAYDLSPATLREYVRTIGKFKPRLLIAYPSVLEELAREVKSAGVHFPHLKAIIVSAETLYPPQRSNCEETFRAPLYDRYGSREVGDVAQQCQARDGLHINMDRVLVEIVRDDLTPCEPGEAGDVLVTDLDNYGMPLIRYAIGDRAVAAAPGRCGCGRWLSRLQSVEGRSLDVVRFPNGSAVGGTYWTILLRKSPGIEKFQVVQNRVDGITVRYVAREPLAHELIAFVCDDVRRRAGEAFQVNFERVERISTGASGKRRIVVSELPRTKAL